MASKRTFNLIQIRHFQLKAAAVTEKNSRLIIFDLQNDEDFLQVWEKPAAAVRWTKCFISTSSGV